MSTRRRCRFLAGVRCAASTRCVDEPTAIFQVKSAADAAECKVHRCVTRESQESRRFFFRGTWRDKKRTEVRRTRAPLLSFPSSPAARIIPQLLLAGGGGEGKGKLRLPFAIEHCFRAFRSLAVVAAVLRRRRLSALNRSRGIPGSCRVHARVKIAGISGRA